MSVRFLYLQGHRLSPSEIKSQSSAVGWLLLVPSTHGTESSKVARLVDNDDRDLLMPLDRAKVTESGRRGMRIEGLVYRRKGRKDAHRDRQVWWVQSPPVSGALLDREGQVRRAEERIERQTAAGWGPV